MYANIFRKMPQWSTLGNHDANNGSTSTTANFPYFDMFTFPTAGECGGGLGNGGYYSFDYGNIHFICLDAQASSTAVDNPSTTTVNEDGPMAAWLRQDLASVTATWIIAFWHHPPYSKGSHDSDSESQLVNMAEQLRANPRSRRRGPALLRPQPQLRAELLLDGHYGVSSTFNSKLPKEWRQRQHHRIHDRIFGGDPARAELLGGDDFERYGRPGGRSLYQAADWTARSLRRRLITPPACPAWRMPAASIHRQCISLSNTVGTVNVDVNGATLTCTYVQSGGTTPDNFITIKKQGAADSDGDGMPDEWENRPWLESPLRGGRGARQRRRRREQSRRIPRGDRSDEGRRSPAVGQVASATDESISVQVPTALGRPIVSKRTTSFPVVCGRWWRTASLEPAAPSACGSRRSQYPKPHLPRENLSALNLLSKNMKLTQHLFTLALLSVSAVHADVTGPILSGYQRLTLLGSSRFRRVAALCSDRGGIGTRPVGKRREITFQGTPGFQAGQFVLSGAQADTFYAIVESGAKEGSAYLVTTKRCGERDRRSGRRQPFHADRRRPCGDHSVLDAGDAFPGGAGIHASASVGNRSTEVMLPDFNATGINSSTSAVYYYFGGHWLKVGDGTNPHDNDTLLSERSFHGAANNVFRQHGICLLRAGPALQALHGPRRECDRKRDNFVACSGRPP